MDKTMTKKQEKQVKAMSEENGLDEAINAAYCNNVGFDSATAEEVEEAYIGEYRSDEDFAREQAYDLGYLTNENDTWPFNCIDWEQAAKELMYDYFESDGYYFRNL